MNNQPRRAIVMGASVAGLWAARVLADHFDEVLIVERDNLPEGPELRPGIPQARQYHIMLLKGLQLMDDLFPGLRTELIPSTPSTTWPCALVAIGSPASSRINICSVVAACSSKPGCAVTCAAGIGFALSKTST